MEQEKEHAPVRDGRFEGWETVPVGTIARNHRLLVQKKQAEMQEWEEWIFQNECLLSVVGTTTDPNPLDYPMWTVEMGRYNVHWVVEVWDDGT